MRTSLLALLATALLLGGCFGERPQGGGWWRYGFSGSSPFWHELHLYDEDPTPDQRLVVAITIFADERTAVHKVFEADSGGMVQRGEAKRGFRRGPQAVALVRERLSGLAIGGEYPPAERLVIVRWHQNGTWVTARFDRAEVPPLVQDIARLAVGEGIGDIAP